jgi:alpha-amylase
MHKILLFYRNQVEDTEKQIEPLPSEIFDVIWNHILAAECNDSYWHGQFGGIYYQFLRHAIFKHLISAKKLLDGIKKKNGLFSPRILVKDILLDGYPDILLENEFIDCFISLSKGGSIYALHDKLNRYNFSNVMSRRIESYHKENDDIIKDRFEKWSFQDHFFFNTVGMKSLIYDKYRELANFMNKPYRILRNRNGKITLVCKGEIKFGNISIETVIKKNYTLKGKIILVNYEQCFSENMNRYNIVFSPEINFIAISHPHNTNMIIGTKKFCLRNELVIQTRKIVLQDLNESENATISLAFPKIVECVIFPLLSISFNNQKQKEYQGTSIFPKFIIEGEELNFDMEIVIS